MMPGIVIFNDSDVQLSLRIIAVSQLGILAAETQEELLINNLLHTFLKAIQRFLQRNTT